MSELTCNHERRAAGLGYPRTCRECGLGVCKKIPTPIQQGSNSKEEAAWSILGLAAEVVVGILDS